MGWISDDNLHEGYLEAVLVDGTTTASSNTTGPVVMGYDDTGHYTGVDHQHTHDEVVAWQLRCDCSTPASFGRVSRWTGPTWQRVATAALENLDAGRIFVNTDNWDASTISERDDVDTAIRARWQTEHITPLAALDTIRTIRTEIATATTHLTHAVTHARANGHTWDAIGKAAGMTRQSAQARWASNP